MKISSTCPICSPSSVQHDMELEALFIYAERHEIMIELKHKKCKKSFEMMIKLEALFLPEGIWEKNFPRQTLTQDGISK